MPKDKFKKKHNNIDPFQHTRIRKNAEYLNIHQTSGLRKSEIQKTLILLKYFKKFTIKEKIFFSEKLADKELQYLSDEQTFTLHLTYRCRINKDDFKILNIMFKKYKIKL